LKSRNWLDEDDYLTNLIKGYYPAIYDRNIPGKTFYSNYIQTTTKTKIKQVYQKANDKVALVQDKDKKAEIIEQRNKEVSKLRITSLWKSYCLDEPQEQECAGVV
jgi:hypothetical protein